MEESKRRYCPHCGSELMRDHPNLKCDADGKLVMVEMHMVLRCRVCPNGYKESLM